MLTPEDRMSDIAKRIRARREELGYSYQQLADETSMSKSTLQRYETGSIKNIPLSRLEDLADALRTTPEYLMGWEDDPYDYDSDPDNRICDVPLAVLHEWQEQGLTPADIVHQNDEYHRTLNVDQAKESYEGTAFIDTPTEYKLKLLARHLEKVPDEQRERLIKNFEDSIDIYLDALGIPKEGE